MTTITARELGAMRNIVNYNLPAEEADYERWCFDEGSEPDENDGHIVHDLRILDRFLLDRGVR